MQEWMLHAFGRSPRVVERLLRVFPQSQIDERIERDRFTAREVIAHLADYEQTVLDRLRVANLKPGNQVPVYDADTQCNEHGFGTKDIFREAEVYESRRDMTIEYLRGLSDECWNKTFVRADGVTVTIKDYVEMVFAHDMEHIDQLSSYLATEVATH